MYRRQLCCSFALGFLLVITSKIGWAQIASKTIVIGEDTFRVVNVDPKKVNLHWKDDTDIPYATVGRLYTDLEKKGKPPAIIMNAGIYSQNDYPAGLHIESGRVLKSLNTKSGKGNFHLQPNGVFFIDKKNNARILTTAVFKEKFSKEQSTNHLRLATQSGPMLLIENTINKKFIESSQSQYSRNGVCTNSKGGLFFVITESSTRVNLYKFAKAMQSLGCNNALYLDGSISKMYVRGEDVLFHFSHFVGLLSVFE